MANFGQQQLDAFQVGELFGMHAFASNGKQ